MSIHCRYATASTEVWSGDRPDALTRVAEPPRDLCAWGHYHPDAAVKLSGAPPWVQREVLAGVAMRRADCVRCPCFERGEPVE